MAGWSFVRSKEKPGHSSGKKEVARPPPSGKNAHKEIKI